MARAKNHGLAGAAPWRFRLRQKDWLPYALVAPAVLLVLFLVIYPAITAVQTSLFDMNLLRLFDKEFIGVGNYEKAFLEDHLFWGSVVRTARWTAVAVVGQIALGLPLALFLNMSFRWRGIMRTLALIPWVVPPPVVAIIWIYMFDGNFGVFNELLVRLGLIDSYAVWLAQPLPSFFVVATAAIWWGFPFMTIMLLAALQALPEEVNQAASIDGANAWQRFLHVTIPQIMPTILIVLLLRSLWFSHAVELIYLMTDGGPGVANHTLAVYGFKLTAIQLNVGYASALMVILAVILLMLVVIFLRQIESSRRYLE